MYQVTFVSVRKNKDYPFWYESEEAAEYNKFVNWLTENRKDLYDEYTAMINDDGMKYVVLWSVETQNHWLEICRLIDTHFPGEPPQTWIPSWKANRGKYFKSNDHKLILIIDENGVRLHSRKVY